MAHSHQRHKQTRAGHKRAAQFIAENRGGACAPKKKDGGAVGHVTRGRAAEKEMRGMERASAEASDVASEYLGT